MEPRAPVRMCRPDAWERGGGPLPACFPMEIRRRVWGGASGSLGPEGLDNRLGKGNVQYFARFDSGIASR